NWRSRLSDGGPSPGTLPPGHAAARPHSEADPVPPRKRPSVRGEERAGPLRARLSDSSSRLAVVRFRPELRINDLLLLFLRAPLRARMLRRWNRPAFRGGRLVERL